MRETAGAGAGTTRGTAEGLGIIARIVAGTVVPIVIAGGCSSQQGASKPSRAQAQPTGAEQRTGAEVAALLAGIPQRGRTLGDPHAPVTVQFFGDLQCPY